VDGTPFLSINGAPSGLFPERPRGSGVAARPFLIRMQPRCINLTFHGVGDAARPLDSGEASVWATRELFLTILDSVAERPDIRISFDDGNASDVALALPALKERGLSATFFIVAGRLGTAGFVDEDGVCALADAGMGIGSHGMRHRPWRRLAERELHEELVGAKTLLENAVERPIAEAACPFGAYDRRVLRMLRRCEYRKVYTSDEGTAAPRDWLQTRNTVRRGDAGEVLERIARLDAPTYNALGRRAKQAAKRWR
jgi:peptidoglycan/xylan/chitin deacetylase (PgdA/CDA1 family)